MTASRHFRRCYLKANKVSKSEGTQKMNRHIIVKTVPMLFAKSKLLCACQNYSLPKLACFS